MYTSVNDAEIQTGTCFLSQNNPRVHVGLGEDTSSERIEVQWPRTKRELFPGVKGLAANP